MSSDLHIAVCPTCQGQGLTISSEGTLSCLACSGKGLWLENDKENKAIFYLPAIISPKDTDWSGYTRPVAYAALSVSLMLLLTASYIIGRDYGFAIASFFWSKGLPQAIFGVSGLAATSSLTYLATSQKSQRLLNQLPEDLERSRYPLNVADYAPRQFSSFFLECARTAAELRMDSINDTVLLIALLKQPRIIGMMARLERSASEIADEAKRLLPPAKTDAVGSVIFNAESRARIYQGVMEGLSHDFPYIELEDILLNLLSENNPQSELLSSFNIGYKEFYAVSRWYAGEDQRSQQWAFWASKGRARPKGYMNRAWTALPTPFLDQYSQDITRLAASGRLPSVSVRDNEINQVLQILGRTQKNSALLVGDPGVGKNTLLGAIALRMIEGRVPEILKDKRLVSMESSALLSGGESAEQNIQQILDEVMRAGNVILAIPDIHMLVGTSGNALDAASLLTGALDRGYIQLISTAAYADYHRYVESNANLSSLLETVEIKEVTAEQAIQILEEEAGVIEHRQKVWLTYPAIEAAAQLAKRYFPDKALPDSAISLLDETASNVQQSSHRWVLKEDVERVVEQKTKVPVRQAKEQEANLLLNLEDELHKRVVGQEEAIHSIASAMRRARAGLHEGSRPISSFLFVGPTGVGKTETAKALSQLYFGGEESMLRLDMSEYQDNRSVYKLIGAPAADSSSHTEGGSLTQPIREHPFSLILLDEIEKAYADVLNLFLQLLDDGRLTENSGRTVYYNNSIVIATSNAGSREIAELVRQGLPFDQLSMQIMQILQQWFKPEFLNRFDAIVPFHPLSQAEIEQVVIHMLQALQEKMTRQKYDVSFTPDLITKLATIGFDPEYGARPLRRVIQDKVEGLLAQKILEGSLQTGQALQITAEMIQ